jgi:hypothetical protein
VERYSFSAGANGFTIIPGQGAAITKLYGDTTGQFNELAALYEFYKINKVMVTLVPSDLYGTGQVSAILSAIDPG